MHKNMQKTLKKTQNSQRASPAVCIWGCSVYTVSLSERLQLEPPDGEYSKNSPKIVPHAN